MLLKSDVSTLVFDSRLQVPVLDPLVVKGTLTYLAGSDGGLFGSVIAGAEGGTSIFEAPGFSLAAAMLIEVNTSPVERQVRSFRRPGEEDGDGDGYVLRGVVPDTIRIAGSGQLVVGGVRFDGWQSLVFDPGRIRMSLVSQASVGFGSLDVAGEATILHGADRETALVLDGRVTGTLADVSRIEGTLRINTGSADFTLGDGTVIEAYTTFDAAFNARLAIGMFRAEVAARMFRSNGLFEIRVDRGSLDFFGISFHLTGFYRSNGEYLLSSWGSISFEVPCVRANATLSMSLGRSASRATSFKGTLVGTTYVDAGWLGEGDGPSFRGDVTFGTNAVSFSCNITVFGVDIPVAFTWKRQTNPDAGPPVPVIARVAGDVLTLSAGDVADRYGVAAAAWYGGIQSESFRVDSVRDASGNVVPGSVVVRSLGVEKTFSGVKTIRADSGRGNDVFEIGPGVDAVLMIGGGTGSDTIIVASPTDGSVLDGGSGPGFNAIRFDGVSTDHVLAADGVGFTITRTAAPSATWLVRNVDSIRFADKTFSSSDLPTETRALAGPIVNGSVHLDLRSYDADGNIVDNCDLTPGEGEPTTGTDSRGVFNFGDSEGTSDDRNADGVVDYRDGMVVVGRYSPNGIGTVTSAVDSITGSDLGFPLVGLPGHGASLLSTIKYATLLRWRPDQQVAGVPVTPEQIESVLGRVLADVPATFTDDDFDPYRAIASADPAEVARGIDTIRFSYTHLGNVLTASAMLREFGLDYANEAAWGYRPDPAKADQLEIVASSAYLKSIAARFGVQPLDPHGRQPVASTFDPLNAAHVRAVFAEILTDWPTRRLAELEPVLVRENLVSNETTEQFARVSEAVERHFGRFLDNMAEGLVLTQKALTRRVVDSGALSGQVSGVGTELLVPGVAGLKRLFIDRLAEALVVEGQKSREDFLAVYNPLFYQPKPVESPTQPTTGLIGLTAPGGGSLVTLSAASGDTVTLRLDYADALGALAAPDYGLAVRYRLGGTARQGIDYTIGGSTLPIATIRPGESSGTLVIHVSPEARAAGDRFLQIELLSADSGMHVDGARAVVTIALGADAVAAGSLTTGSRTVFVPHSLQTASGDGPATIQAPLGGSGVVLRGVNGRADTFVVGIVQSQGMPFIENFRAADGDRIVIEAGDLVAHRRSNQLADEANRAAALVALRERYGETAVNGLATDVLDALVAAEIEAIAPLSPFKMTELNTYGGFVFDVAGRMPVAMASDYSSASGDIAWSSLSMNPTAGTAYAIEVLLSGRLAASIAEDAAVGTVIGSLATTATSGGSLSGPFTYALAAGVADNAPFTIDGDRLVLFRALDFESRASYRVLVTSTDGDGNVHRGSFLVTIRDSAEAPVGVALSATEVAENLPAGTVVGTLSTTDEDLGGRATYTLVAGVGGEDNACFRVEGDRLLTARVFDREWLATRSVRVRATDDTGLVVERAFSIRVLDVADTPFALAMAGTTVSENALIGSFIGSLSGPGAGSAVRCTLVDGEGASGNGLVAIRGNRLFVAAAIDHETTPNFTVRVRGTDASGVTSEGVFTIIVRDVKERPSVVLPTSFTATEDMPTVLVFEGRPFRVDDASPSTRIVVTVRVEKGTLHAVDGDGVTVGGTPSARTLTGSVASLNAYVTDPQGRIKFVPAKDDAGSRRITVTIAEWFQGGVLSSTAASRIVIAPVDDAPLLKVPERLRVVEDVRGAIVFPAEAFSDVDSPSLTVTLAVGVGELTARSGGGVVVGGDAKHRTLAGSPAALAAFARLGRLSYVTEPDGTGPRTLTVSLSDGTSTVRRDVTIVVVPVDDRPVLAASGILGGSPPSGRAIGHEELLQATAARDPDGSAVRFTVERVAGGTLEAWDGKRWTAVRPSVFMPGSASPTPGTIVIGIDTVLRWRPAPSGERSIVVRGWAGSRASASTCRLRFAAE
jgi:hypothetical protein